MLKLAIIACVVGLAMCADPPRPIPGANWEAGVYVEMNGPDGVFAGDGFMAWSPKQNQGLADYKLRHRDRIEPTFVWELFRNDLGEVFEADSADRGECRMRVVTGPLPNYWAWLAQADFVGIDYFKGVQLDLWQYSANGFTIRLGVQAPYYNNPFILWEVNSYFEKITQFSDFTVNATINPRYFDVPKACGGANAKVGRTLPNDKATPIRPVIPDNFYAEVAVESIQGTARIEGEGVFACDYQDNMSVDDLRLRGGLNTIRVYELQRYDLGQVFEIDSKDSEECRMREVTGHMPPPWDWIANAKYIGQDLFRHAIVDLWAYGVGSNVIELGVLEGYTTQPLFTRQRGPGYELINVFNKWQANPPLTPKYFNVPAECQSASQVQQTVTMKLVL